MGVPGVCDTVGTGSVVPRGCDTRVRSYPGAVTQGDGGQMSPEAVTPQRGPGWGQGPVTLQRGQG